MNKAFTDEDFNFENIEKVVYGMWYPWDEGSITVYLKKTGKRKVEDAIKHFEKLEFVNYAEKDGYYILAGSM